MVMMIVLAASCKKEKPLPPPQPEPSMRYTDLGDTAIRINHSATFDLNGDGEWDVFFGTLYVGDPLFHVDKRQWLVGSSFNANLPVNGNEKIPMLQKHELIPINGFPGYGWFNASMILLTQKIIGIDVPEVWEGDWTNANHRFIPIQVKKNDALYNGWVEVSFSTTEEKLFVHKAAISTDPGVSVKAGR